MSDMKKDFIGNPSYVAVVSFQNPIIGNIESRVKICQPETTVREIDDWKQAIGTNLIMSDVSISKPERSKEPK